MEIHVAPDGDDEHGDGSEAKPFATLARARDEVRRVKAGKGPIGILLAPGEYPLAAGLVLEARDSESENAPVVFRAKEKGKAVLYGGTRLSGFMPVTDRHPERLPGGPRQGLPVTSSNQIMITAVAGPWFLTSRRPRPPWNSLQRGADDPLCQNRVLSA